jgi:putative redox protein
MATSAAPRTVGLERTSRGRFVATNDRGGRLVLGAGDDAEFTPTELFLAAIGGCTAIDVDVLTSRRAEPSSFSVTVGATKVRDGEGNRLADIEVVFRVRFPDGADGDAAREVLPESVRRSHDRLCVVGRTVATATPITTQIE